MEGEDKHQENTAAADKSEPFSKDEEDMTKLFESIFSKDEDMIKLLKTIFNHGYPDLPSNILPGKSAEEREFARKSLLEQAKSAIQTKPTLTNWLQSGLLVDEEFNIPLALSLIEWCEPQPTPYEENGECYIREIYQFIYKMMMNQPASRLTPNSAKVLYTLLSEIIEEAWPSSEDDLMDYLGNTCGYSRSGLRRTYPGKK